jgi:hypothetical protein
MRLELARLSLFSNRQSRVGTLVIENGRAVNTRHVAAEADIDALVQGHDAAKTTLAKWKFDSR